MRRLVITFILILVLSVIVFSFKADIEGQRELERMLKDAEREYNQAVAKGDKISANRAAAMYNDYIFSFSSSKLPKGIKYRLDEVK